MSKTNEKYIKWLYDGAYIDPPIDIPLGNPIGMLKLIPKLMPLPEKKSRPATEKDFGLRPKK